ncbi:MAG: pyridoxal-phosphate dependent enzyme, partial [Lysobacteraceae bacterium]
MSRQWVNAAIAALEADFQRSADTHLIRLDLPAYPGIPLYFKDESSHPTGSLKHRLARSLFLYSLCNGWLREGQTVIEASSGSTAVSEAYFARLVGLPFIAVMPNTTSREKVARIEFYGGRCHMIEGADVSAASRALAAEIGGHFMDQFTYAERATDWRGNNNIAESIFEQLKLEPHPCPRWIVVSAGTGGTAATMGRYIRYQPTRNACTRLAVVDPECSVFFDAYKDRKRCHRLDLPAYPGIPLYFKDESSHPTGSLKHRLARSLFLYALCNGWLREGQTVIEASSGSTAVSEAYFARLVGLPYIAVMPNTTSREKIARIEFYGGRCHMIEGADVSAAS